MMMRHSPSYMDLNCTSSLIGQTRLTGRTYKHVIGQCTSRLKQMSTAGSLSHVVKTQSLPIFESEYGR